MTLELLIIQYKHLLNANDSTVLYAISKNPGHYADLSLVDLAAEFHLSKSYVFNLTQKIGFSGYSEFKYFLKNLVAKKTESNTSLDSYSLLLSDLEATKSLLEQIDFSIIVEAIAKAPRIFCFGTGNSQQTMLRQLSKNLLSSGKLTLTISSIPEFDVVCRIIEEGDLLIIASVSGETTQLKEKLTLVKLKKVSILSITHFKSNSISTLSDYKLFFESTPFSLKKATDEIFSFMPMELTLDILVRKYIDYLNSY